MTAQKEAFDAIIIGAGAAGLMCALTAGQRGRKVLLLEHTDKAGAKILISGGGRCNFTNLDSAPNRFSSGNPHFCTSALSRYTQSDFIALVQRHRIPFHEKTLGQLFCDGSARAIVAMLLEECALAASICGWGRPSPSVTRGRSIPRRNRIRDTSPRRPWCWRRAGFRFRRWARRASVTTSRGSSVCASPKHCPGSCRSRPTPTNPASTRPSPVSLGSDRVL